MKNGHDNSIPPEVMAEMEDAVSKALTGVRDRKTMRKACERMDRIGEQVRKKHGVLNIGVRAIRELRDGK